MEVARVVASLGFNVNDDGAVRFEKKLRATRSDAKKPVTAQLGADEKDKQVWAAYQRKLDQTQKTIARKDRFIAKLGADFDKRAFNSAERELNKLEREAKQTSRAGSGHMRGFGSSVRGSSLGMVKSLAGPILAFTSLAGTVALLKKSVSSVETLAKGTAMLSRTTGLDNKTSSEWVQSAKARGVEAKALNMGFISLAKNIKAATDGGEKSAAQLVVMEIKQKRLTVALEEAQKAGDPKKVQTLRQQLNDLGDKMEKTANGAGKQAKAFNELGVSQDMLKRGDVNEIISHLADGFAKLPDGAHKATLAQMLFARQSQTLLPLLNKGSGALQEQLGLVDKYGATLDENGVKKAMAAIAAQRELKLAWQGVQVFLGTQLLPAVTKVARGLATFIAGMREGTGAGGAFLDRLRPVISTIKGISSGIAQLVRDFNDGRASAVLLVAILGGLAAGALAVKAVAAATRAWAAAQVLLDIAFAGSGIGAIIIGIVALGTALFIAYKKSETFRTIVNGVFGAVKKVVLSFADAWLGMITTVLGGLSSMATAASHLPFVGDKFKGVASAIDGVRDKIDKMRESLRKGDDAQRSSGQEADKQKAKIANLGDAYDAAKKKQDSLKQGTDEYRAAARITKQREDELNDAVKGLATRATGAKKPVATLKQNIGNLGDTVSSTAAAVIDDLNAALKGMGAKQVKVRVGTAGRKGASTDLGAPSLGGFARGGVPHPGSGAKDDHVLLDAGGRPVAAMSGTEGILNTPQMGVVDYALGGMAAMGLLPKGMGGLDELWGSGMRHYASGGVMGRANLLESLHLPYIWGGHHGDQGPIKDPRPGVDCSSAVSFVLGIPPRVSGEFENYGTPGGGGPIGIFANAGHVFMRIGSRFFGTSKSNPGGGAGWIPARSSAGFVERSTSGDGGMAEITAPSITGDNEVGVSMGKAAGKMLAKAANSYLVKQAGAFIGGGNAQEGGGKYSKTELAALWRRANPRQGNPNLMAAIALAESGGDPGIVNSIGASGLWQIHPQQPGSLDPFTNAQQAGAKLATQGLGAWEAYTNGSYKRFLKRGGLLRRFANGGLIPGFARGASLAKGKKKKHPDGGGWFDGVYYAPVVRAYKNFAMWSRATHQPRQYGSNHFRHDAIPAFYKAYGYQQPPMGHSKGFFGYTPAWWEKEQWEKKWARGDTKAEGGLLGFSAGGSLADVPHFGGGGGLGSALSGGGGGGGGRPANQASGSGSTGGSYPSLRALRGSQGEHISAYDRAVGDLADLRRHYEQTDRRYGQSVEVYVNPDTGLVDQPQIEKRAGELAGLMRIAERIKRKIEKIREIARSIVKTYTEIIKRLRGSKRHAKKKDRSGIQASIDHYESQREIRRGDIKDLGFDITDAGLDIGDIQKEGSELRGIRSEAPTPDTTGDTGGTGDTGTGGGDNTVTNELTPDQQAQLAQVEQLKAIVARGTFLDTTAAGVLGGVTNPSKVGQAAPPPSVSPGLAFKAQAMGVDLNAPVGAAVGGGGGSTTINNYISTLTPGDPAMLNEIGKTVTAGLSYQGAQGSPRADLGL